MEFWKKNGRNRWKGNVLFVVLAVLYDGTLTEDVNKCYDIVFVFGLYNTNHAGGVSLSLVHRRLQTQNCFLQFKRKPHDPAWSWIQHVIILVCFKNNCGETEDFEKNLNEFI